MSTYMVFCKIVSECRLETCTMDMLTVISKRGDTGPSSPLTDPLLNFWPIPSFNFACGPGSSLQEKAQLGLWGQLRGNKLDQIRSDSL